MRMQDFQARLDALDEEVAAMKRRAAHLEAEAQAMRQLMLTMSLQTVAELSLVALKKAQCVASNEEQKSKLDLIMEQTLEPSAASRMAAWDSLRTMHFECPACESGESKKKKKNCPLGNAQLISRDLAVLTVTIGRGPLSHKYFQELCEHAFKEGCGKDNLDKVEKSMLTLSLKKIIDLGRSRTVFHKACTSPEMHGPDVSEEQLDQVYRAYSAVANENPNYESKTKGKKKGNKNTEKTEDAEDNLMQHQEEAEQMFSQSDNLMQHQEEADQMSPQSEHYLGNAELYQDRQHFHDPQDYLDHALAFPNFMPTYGCIECGSENLHGAMTPHGFRCFTCYTSYQYSL